ncbi:MAG: selenide, water dikinase SelD [Bdellovibrionales bacterium]|nr:selenide, water dikinase SelD [Bdellovibrionales bacterium]
MQNNEPIRLTQTVKKGGCAAKLPAGELQSVLSGLEKFRPKNLILGYETMDDACLWDLEDGRYIVQTLDFFTPIVDDPFDFGAIAAANAISDIYAMGGKPSTAMTILAFPASQLPMTLIRPLMEGAISILSKAGVALAGGHTIDDETLKLGFSVSGFVDKNKAWTNAQAKPGDALILTKALGTGTITAALKKGEAKEEWVKGAIKSMTTLNDVIDALSQIEVHSATDITGFGLAGHATQMASASDCVFRINPEALPILKGANECLKLGFLTRAHATNESYTAAKVKWELSSSNDSLWPDWKRKIILDPQTSGGLLIAVPAKQIDKAISAIQKAGFESAIHIGYVESKALNADPYNLIFT